MNCLPQKIHKMNITINNSFNNINSTCYLNDANYFNHALIKKNDIIHPDIDAVFSKLYEKIEIEMRPKSAAEVFGERVLRPLVNKLHSCSDWIFDKSKQKHHSSAEFVDEAVDLVKEAEDMIAKRIKFDNCVYDYGGNGCKYYNRIHPAARELVRLQKRLSDQYYVFSHGMSQIQNRITKLIGNLDHRLWPSRHSKDFIFSRVVPPNKAGTSLNELLARLTDDHKMRRELLSADADLLNTEVSESAIDFYLRNSNVFDNIPSIICDVLNNFANEFNMNFYVVECLEKLEIPLVEFDFESVFDFNNKKLGVILVYAVPKNLVHNPDRNFVYTALPYGKPVDKGHPLARLDELVEGPSKNTGVSVRLLTSHLKPENGIKAFLIGDAKDETYEDKLLTQMILKMANSFFQEVVNHCSSYSYYFFGLDESKECRRLLKEL